MALGFGGVAAGSVRWRRIAPGLYEADTPRGTFRVERYETLPEWRRYYLTRPSPPWVIIWPGQKGPDEERTSLREAKLVVEREAVR